ncbi:MAG: TlpA family protein disulfide reductase [Bacteroidales bacterium]|nr:TlpA family protein disulfide reductase [Bacteroidales bacterium]
MKRGNSLFLAALLLCAAACSPKTEVKGILEGGADRSLVLRRLDLTGATVPDTIKTDAQGRFRFAPKVEKGRPEFVYIFSGDTKIASLLLERGERVQVQADTLGHYNTEGSEGSKLMEEVDRDYAAFAGRMLSLADAGAPSAELGQTFVDHYRKCVRFVLEHPTSLASVPVLYQNLNAATPVFGQATDALHFRSVCDSLTLRYPESPYVKALERETKRREQILSLNTQLAGAPQTAYPDLELPGMDGKKVALSSLDAKAILVHFWTSENAEQKMLNLEELKPLYETWHPRGLEIYSVCFDIDKPRWAASVRAQELPWINVNDGLGANSPVLSVYNVQTLPSSVLIADGTVSRIKGAQELRRELARLLR